MQDQSTRRVSAQKSQENNDIVLLRSCHNVALLLCSYFATAKLDTIFSREAADRPSTIDANDILNCCLSDTLKHAAMHEALFRRQNHRSGSTALLQQHNKCRTTAAAPQCCCSSTTDVCNKKDCRTLLPVAVRRSVMPVSSAVYSASPAVLLSRLCRPKLNMIKSAAQHNKQSSFMSM